MALGSMLGRVVFAGPSLAIVAATLKPLLQWGVLRLDSGRSRAIGAGLGIGVGIGAGWGIVMSQFVDGRLTTGVTMSAGAGLVIALVSVAAVYRTVTEA